MTFVLLHSEQELVLSIPMRLYTRPRSAFTSYGVVLRVSCRTTIFFITILAYSCTVNTYFVRLPEAINDFWCPDASLNPTDGFDWMGTDSSGTYIHSN